jgi:peptidoglycan/LPS O-acetylase OafA/YrhL
MKTEQFDRNLHGLRGVLAIAVVMSHTGFADVGVIAVWFFFVLSGYLLARPYDRGMDGAQLGRYFVRRFFRIYPAFSVCLLLWELVPAYWIIDGYSRGRFEHVQQTLLDHLLLLRGDVHLWTIPQELLGYALIGALMLVRRRLPVGWFVPLCIAAAAACELLLTAEVLPMGTDGPARPLHAALFIIGVIASTVRLPRTEWFSTAALVVLGTIFFAGLCPDVLGGWLGTQHWHMTAPVTVWGVIAAAVILALANGRPVLEGLQFFGTLGYGIYLFHFPVAMLLTGRVSQGPQAFFLTLAITVALAWLSWRYIEAPCIDFAHRLSARRPGPIGAAPERASD